MKKNHLSILVGIAFLALLVFLLWKPQKKQAPDLPQKEAVRTNQAPPSQPLSAAAAVATTSQVQQAAPPTNPATPEDRKATIAEFAKAVAAALNTPITFYGRVVDESNQPVAGATAYFNAVDKFDAPGTDYQRTADANGYFSISGIHGADLGVGVGKEGYYSRDQSHAYFNYGNGPKGKNRTPPTRDNPAVFVLAKMGETEPLIHNERNVSMPKNGTPVGIDLATGKAVPAGSGNIIVQCWTHDEAKIPNHRLEYAWNCKVTVPGGGLQYRTNEFQFEAPLEGYYQTDEMGMPQPNVRWNAHIKRNYFLKLGDGRYARVQFEMVAAGGHFASIETYLNPIPGHRNLEFDPKKEIKTNR